MQFTCLLPSFCWVLIPGESNVLPLTKPAAKVAYLLNLLIQNTSHDCDYYACAAWHQMVRICSERWCTEANEATQTHCYNPVAPATPAYHVWAYCACGRQRICQEDPVSFSSDRLEKTTRSSLHHMIRSKLGNGKVGNWKLGNRKIRQL